MPERVQLSRRRKLPAGAKSVARPTKWGNPFKVRAREHGGMEVRFTEFRSFGTCYTNEAAVDAFRWWLKHTADGRRLAEEAKRELRGCDLACWCGLGEACHADVWLEVANG